MIENKEVAKESKVYFDMLWNQDVIVTKGMDALKTAVLDYIENVKPQDKYTVIDATFGETGTDKQYANFF